jgi:rare lipoprotein A
VRYTFYLFLLSLSLLYIGCASSFTRSVGTQEGLASYYSTEFQGRKTSSGEMFDKDALTAAHRTFPFGTIILVTNQKNGKQVEVKVNDRGPVKPERIIDLSYGAAKEIDMLRDGLVRVRVEVVEWGR